MGPKGFKPFYRQFRQAFSDIHVRVDAMYVDGDVVIAVCTVTGVHNDTKNPVTFTGVTVSVVQDGKLMGGSNHFDFLSMYVQMGKVSAEQLV